MNFEKFTLTTYKLWYEWFNIDVKTMIKNIKSNSQDGDYHYSIVLGFQYNQDILRGRNYDPIYLYYGFGLCSETNGKTWEPEFLDYMYKKGYFKENK